MTRDGQAGITLIEVLVVLAVIGVGAGATMMGMGGTDRSTAAQAEAQRLARNLSLGVDEAMLLGQPLAVLWDTSGYRFVQQPLSAEGGPDGWPAATQRSLAQRHDLAAPLELRLQDAASPAPVLLPVSGAAPDVVFQISGKGPAWTVVFDGFSATAQPGSGT